MHPSVRLRTRNPKTRKLEPEKGLGGGGRALGGLTRSLGLGIRSLCGGLGFRVEGMELIILSVLFSFSFVRWCFHRLHAHTQVARRTPSTQAHACTHEHTHTKTCQTSRTHTRAHTHTQTVRHICSDSICGETAPHRHQFLQSRDWIISRYSRTRESLNAHHK